MTVGEAEEVRAEDLLRSWWRQEVPEDKYHPALALLHQYTDQVKLDRDGLLEDLAVLVVELHRISGYAGREVVPTLYSAAAARTLAELWTLVVDARRSRLSMDAGEIGIREGWIQSLEAETQDNLRKATSLPEDCRYLGDLEVLRAIPTDLRWLAGAFDRVGDTGLSSRCRAAARILTKEVERVGGWLKAAKAFDQHWCGRGGGPLEDSDREGL